MNALTLNMLAKVEELKAKYAEFIARESEKGNDTSFEYGQYVRLTTIESYLDERTRR